jgi:hypothetical protein
MARDINRSIHQCPANPLRRADPFDAEVVQQPRDRVGVS